MFRIDGAHEKAKCIDCHHQSGPDFSKAPSQCSGCHIKADAHGRQFSQEGREEDCSSCHTPARWSIGDFNHERARFPLDVAHRNVACASCHKMAGQPDGKMIRSYRDTPTECVKCH